MTLMAGAELHLQRDGGAAGGQHCPVSACICVSLSVSVSVSAPPFGGRSWGTVLPSACVRACVSTCVRACVRACVLACVSACVLACVRACVGVSVCLCLCLCLCLRPSLVGAAWGQCVRVRACARARVRVRARLAAPPFGGRSWETAPASPSVCARRHRLPNRSHNSCRTFARLRRNPAPLPFARLTAILACDHVRVPRRRFQNRDQNRGQLGVL